MGGSWAAEIAQALYIIAGAIGSKLGAQMVLGTSNTGFIGYWANLAAGGVLAYAAKALMKNDAAAKGIFAGAPQRYVDGLNSAQIEIPTGWGPGAPVVMASSGVNANAVAAGSDGMGAW
jgi:hypothetical protein